MNVSRSFELRTLSCTEWAKVDSNHRPRAYQARALTSWAISPSSALNAPRSPLVPYSPHSWWRWRGSNPWPPACRAGALPAELHPHGVSCFLNDLFRSFKIEQQEIFPSLCATLSRLSRFVYTRPWATCFALLRKYGQEELRSLFPTFSIERRWSSRTFRYGYLVTT